MRNTRTNQKIPGSEDNGDEETSFGPVDVIFGQRPAVNPGGKDRNSPSQGDAGSKITSGRDAGSEAVTALARNQHILKDAYQSSGERRRARFTDR